MTRRILMIFGAFAALVAIAAVLAAANPKVTRSIQDALPPGRLKNALGFFLLEEEIDFDCPVS